MHYVLPQYNQDKNSESIDIQCSITSAGGSCTEAIVRAGLTLSQEASSYTNFASEIGFQNVPITAGPTPGATGSSSTVPLTSTISTSSAATIKTGDISTASGPTSSGSVPTSSSASSTRVSTGGVQMITGHPQWFVGGAAAAVAIAAL